MDLVSINTEVSYSALVYFYLNYLLQTTVKRWLCKKTSKTDLADWKVSIALTCEAMPNVFYISIN